MNCVICDKEIDRSVYSYAILCSDECYTEHFWRELIPEVNNPRIARINHVHYSIVPDVTGSGFRGHGGREFHIHFNDGRNIVTHNLWCQGDIPEKYWTILPDNAEFTSIASTDLSHPIERKEN